MSSERTLNVDDVGWLTLLGIFYRAKAIRGISYHYHGAV
jgi:hypothetical protein